MSVEMNSNNLNLPGVSDRVRTWPMMARYACLGALAGLLWGLFEAILLWRIIRSPFLLKPSVSHLIWFLGPLVDSATMAIIGFIAGFIVTATGNKSLTRRVVGALRPYWFAVVTFGLGIIAVTVAETATGSAHRSYVLLEGTAILLSGVCAHLASRCLRLKTLGIGLGGVFAFLLAGVGFYSFLPSVQATAAAASPESVRSQPNIILISLDTVRADHLSVYGYPRPTTPQLRKWAQRGVVFENAVAPSSWTLASHASMFTGLLPHQHGADWHHPLDTRPWSLAEVLTSWGYETAGFTSNLWYGEGGWGMDQGFEWYDDDSISILHNLRALLAGGRVIQPVYYHVFRPDSFDRRDASQINRDVLRWLKGRSRQPFFLFINYFDAHDPYFAPPHAALRFGDVPRELIEKVQSAIEGKTADIPPQDKARLIAAYDNCVGSLDDALGKLLDSLSDLPGWSNTVVIITSDHGESFGEHRTYGHGLNLYREVLRVPLILFGPHIPEGLRIMHLVRTQDLFSTVLELARTGETTFQRNAIQRYWTAGFQPDEFDDLVISELLPKFHSAALLPTISLTTPEWQYICNWQGREELYRWTSDQTEQTNLATSAEYQRVAAELRARLNVAVGESRRPWISPQYLLALGPDRAWAMVSSAESGLGSGSLQLTPRIGDAQHHFPPKLSSSSRRPRPSDEELLRSLPYY